MATADRPFVTIRGRVDWQRMVDLAREQRAAHPDDPGEWWVRTDESMNPAIVKQIDLLMIRAIPDPSIYEFTTRKDPANPRGLARAAFIYMRHRS